MYWRAIEILKKIESNLDENTVDSIVSCVKTHLGDGRVQIEYWKNQRSNQSRLVRELKSIMSSHFTRVCYDDGWGWGCWICEGGSKKSNHWEGKELKKWTSFACKISKYLYYFDEQRTHWPSSYEYKISCMHLTKDDYI